MKPFILVLLLLVVTFSLNGQYKTTAGEEQQNIPVSKQKSELLLKRASNLKTAGVMMTILGSATFVVSTMGWIKVQNEGSGDPPFDKMKKYEIVMGLSAPVPLIGAICWLSGDSKQRQIGISYYTINESAFAAGIGLKVRF